MWENALYVGGAPGDDGIILRTRPRKSAHAYKQVWTNEGSPLKVHHAV